MNDALKMQISAFVDGELPENESELLLRRLSQDPMLRQQVAQYLEIGRLMRREREAPGMNDLRDRIAAALGEEPLQPAVASKTSGAKFTRPAVGVAIAASVAVMALIALRQVYVPNDGANPVNDFAGITVPDSHLVADQPDDALLRQLYLHHNPRLVTWQLQDGVLVELEAEGEPAEADRIRTDEGSPD